LDGQTKSKPEYPFGNENTMEQKTITGMVAPII